MHRWKIGPVKLWISRVVKYIEVGVKKEKRPGKYISVVRIYHLVHPPLQLDTGRSFPQ